MPPATFLRPNAAEQSQLRAKAEEKLRAKKAKDKVDAADRKRKRDKEKERIAAIEEELAARKAKREESPFKKAVEDARQSPEDIERDQVCNEYLDREAMLGRSGYDDRDMIKELCGDKGVRVFDGDLRMWGTKSHERLIKLMESYRWTPFGVPEEWHDRLRELAGERAAALHLTTEAANMVKREAATTVSPEEAARIAAERERAQRAAQLREWYTPPTEKELSEVKALKLDNVDFLNKTQGLAELGPIVGLSPEARVLRWLDIEVYGARCKYERDPSYWDEMFMSAVEEGARAAGLTSGDEVSPLPFAPEIYQNEFASAVADMRNSVKDRKNAQTSCAGQFIYSHIQELNVPWLHIDLAGPAMPGKRASGYGVALISEVVRSLEDAALAE